jgi:hypothetical protein
LHGSRTTRLLAIFLLFLFLASSQIAPSYSNGSSPPPNYQCPSGLPSSAPQCNPYTNFQAYQNYLESFYQGTAPIPGFRAYPLSDPSNNDYCNYWMDDAGKMLTAFSYFGNTKYATDAADYIMGNSINSNGFTYLPERYVQGCQTYLHVNSSQLASPLYEITYSPVHNPSFELANTSSNQPQSWAVTNVNSPSGIEIYSQNNGTCADGLGCVETQNKGAGSASYYQNMNVSNSAVFFAHYVAGAINNGIIGNYTASFLETPRQTTASATSTSQFTFGFDTYPVLLHDTVIPANSGFEISAVLSANATVTGATFGVQVNEVCNNYGTETSPWGGEQSTTVTLTTTPTLYTWSVGTTTSPTTVPAGCAFHIIYYVNPNTTHPYTITLAWDSRSQEAYAKVPWIPALANLDNQPSTAGFAIQPLAAGGSTNSYYFAIVTSGGTILLENGTVNTADIPNLVSPVVSYNFDTGPLGQWNYINVNAATLGGSIPQNSIIKYLEFGSDGTSGNTAAYWDDVFYILDLGAGNAPYPGSGQYMTSGYYYANNGIMGIANYSSIENTHVYEKTMAVAIITDTENRTNYQLHNQIVQQAFGGSPYITDFFIWDSDNNASGYMGRQIFPYSIDIGSVPYRLYVSGGNGSAINIDFWIGVNTYQNLYAWINETMSVGTDYVEPTLTAQNLGTSYIVFNDLNFGLGSLDTFMKYNPYWSWLQLSNGTIVEAQHGFNDTYVSNPNSYFVYTAGQKGFANGVTPSALLWTGFKTPEFADGFLVQPLAPASVEEIDYVSNFFGHSIRIVNNLNGQGLSMGQLTTSFSFKFTTLAKTLWTEPSVLLNVFLNHVVGATNGIDMSYAGTWGFDTYGLATWGLASNNQTVLNFAKQLWNSQYQDASQRLHPTNEPYNPTSQPVIYYRSLYLFTIAGLLLYPDNSTVQTWANNVVTYAITDQMNSYGLPFGLEENGWAVNLLSTLYANGFTTPAEQQIYNQDIQDIVSNVGTNLNFEAQTPSSWPLYPTNYLTNTPSLWNFNATGAVNAYCNHPQNVFRCGEFSFAIDTAYHSDPLGTLSYFYDTNGSLVSMSNFWGMSYLENLTSPASPCSQSSGGECGYSIDVRYADNSGNSNTETDPVSLLGMIAWMENMQSATGTYISNLHGAGLTSINFHTGSISELIIGLSVPTGNTANITVNLEDVVSSPQYKPGSLAATDNGIAIPGTFDASTGDLILNNVASTLVISWGLNGNSTNHYHPPAGNCNPLPPTLLGMLESGCWAPAILGVFAGPIGPEWTIGIVVGIVAGMLYLKTESTWIPLVVILAAAPVIGYELPAQFSGLVYLFYVIAIAGLLYLGFKARGS